MGALFTNCAGGGGGSSQRIEFELLLFSFSFVSKALGFCAKQAQSFSWGNGCGSFVVDDNDTESVNRIESSSSSSSRELVRSDRHIPVREWEMRLRTVRS